MLLLSSLSGGSSSSWYVLPRKSITFIAVMITTMPPGNNGWGGFPPIVSLQIIIIFWFNYRLYGMKKVVAQPVSDCLTECCVSSIDGLTSAAADKQTPSFFILDTSISGNITLRLQTSTKQEWKWRVELRSGPVIHLAYSSATHANQINCLCYINRQFMAFICNRTSLIEIFKPCGCWCLINWF